MSHLCYRDFIYGAAGEREFAVRAGDHIADHAAARGDGGRAEKLSVFGLNPTTRFGVTPVSAYQTIPSELVAIP